LSLYTKTKLLSVAGANPSGVSRQP